MSNTYKTMHRVTRAMRAYTLFLMIGFMFIGGAISEQTFYCMCPVVCIHIASNMYLINNLRSTVREIAVRTLYTKDNGDNYRGNI